jgi:hypothetical protein
MLVEAALLVPTREEKMMLRNKVNNKEKAGKAPSLFIFSRIIRRFDMGD